MLKGKDSPSSGQETGMSVPPAAWLLAPDGVKDAVAHASDRAAVTAIDVADALASVESALPSQSLLTANLQALQARFPEVAKALATCTGATSIVEIRSSAEGAVLYYKGQCLDHPTKPLAAARAWASKELITKEALAARSVCIFGFSNGYHVEAVLEQLQSAHRSSAAKIAVTVHEPHPAVLYAACSSRDLRALFTQLDGLSVGDQAPATLQDTTHVIMRPQVGVLFAEEAKVFKAHQRGVRARTELHPMIGVLGPLAGGTLPIMGYCLRSLSETGQRMREFDMSPFNGGYMTIEKLARDPLRKSALGGHYVETISQIILESINERPIDILLCMAQAPISARALAELRKRGVITVLWFVEDYLRFTYWKEFAKHYDYIFTIQKGACIEALKAAGCAEVHYLPTAADPGVHVPLTLNAEERARWGSPLSFVGAGYHNRVQTFVQFSELPIKLWGTEWPTVKPFDKMVQEQGRRLTPNEYVKIFNATDVNINLHSSTEREGVDPYGDFINPRTFELAAAGAFQLVDERTHLAELLTPGEEVITFKDTADLKEKALYYLNRPEERAAIAQKARARVLREHTYNHRLQKMLEVIYQRSYDQLVKRYELSPWSKMLSRSAGDVELHQRIKRSYLSGEDPNLDGLLVDTVTGKGKLSETEKKLLFLFHVKKQIVRMAVEPPGGKKP